jgi:N-terminal domain of anti-restriction factor ArdC
MDKNMKKSDKGKEIFDGFDNKIKELEEKIESPETEKAIKEWLKFQSKFHNYSFRNTIWMMLQAEARGFEIEKVAPFKKWTEMKGVEDQKVSITKGSKGFTVLFPYEHISYERDEKGKFVEDKNGKRIPERDENGKIKKRLCYGTGYVFDIKQTNAKEIGAFQELNYRGEAVEVDADLLKEVASRITEKYKIQVDFVKDPSCTAGGWYNPSDNKIGINLATCKHNAHRLGTLFHELGHNAEFRIMPSKHGQPAHATVFTRHNSEANIAFNATIYSHMPYNNRYCHKTRRTAMDVNLLSI